MHDLNTIIRLNNGTFAKSIENFRAQGRFVLSHYEGVHLVSIESFSNADQASDAHFAAVTGAGPGERYVVHAPTSAFHTAQRDQSEDRQAPALDQIAAWGSGDSTEKTLGDYISRKGA